MRRTQSCGRLATRCRPEAERGILPSFFLSFPLLFSSTLMAFSTLMIFIFGTVNHFWLINNMAFLKLSGLMCSISITICSPKGERAEFVMEKSKIHPKPKNCHDSICFFYYGVRTLRFLLAAVFLTGMQCTICNDFFSKYFRRLHWACTEQ